MEEYFYEFWKNQFINVDKGQKQMEDMTRWIMGGLSSYEELSEKFGKFCSMDFWSKETHDYIKAWETSTEDFQKLFRYHLNLMGLVPKYEHLALINKYNDLNQSVIDQKKEVSDQKKLVTDQEKEISKQKTLVVDQKKLVTDLKKEISDQKKITANQNKEIANQKKRVADLKKEIAGQIKSLKQFQSQASG